jgi:hypothetical protein
VNKTKRRVKRHTAKYGVRPPRNYGVHQREGYRVRDPNSISTIIDASFFPPPPSVEEPKKIVEALPLKVITEQVITALPVVEENPIEAPVVDGEELGEEEELGELPRIEERSNPSPYYSRSEKAHLKERVFQLRRQGLSQTAISSLSGVPQTTISDWLAKGQGSAKVR